MTVARRLLIHVALGVAFVVVVVTAVTYALVYDALKKSGLKQLDTYVGERAEREEARFLGIQTNMLLVRAQFLQRLERATSPEHIEERFNTWYRHYEDGAWRSREQFNDPHKTSSMWATAEWEATPEQRRQVVIAQELCDEMLPGWYDSFPSYYLQFPKPGLANVGVDVLLWDWSWKMPAHFDTAGVEWIALALPERVDDPDRFLWTGLQQDDVVSEPLVNAYLPVMKDGVFIGSVGHNMNMGRMIDAAARSEVDGASHFIFRTDGRLIAHPAKRAEILASKGLLTAQDCGDRVLASIYRIASQHAERRFGGFDPASDVYYSVARLAGPEWFYVTTMSRDYLQRQAFASAQWVLWSGLISLALVLGFIALALNAQVARPLAELTRATEAMSAGNSDPALVPRADELGELAASFREMVSRVHERESDLRQLNLTLERRVAARTADLDQALARERELGEMKSNFVSLVSHEFRTPLGVIMSAAEVLDRYFERLTGEKRARHLGMILKSTKNLAKLIEEVLLLSRVEEGRMQFAPVPIELEPLCHVVCDEIRSATGSVCSIRFHASSSLEGAVSDEALLRHILTNLLSNACKYSEPGSPVDFLAERRNGDVVFTVGDRGIGIPLEDQERLFTSFTRGRNVGSRPGTGLGLVIVQRSVQLHGGTLRLDSTPGEGTTVTVTLPVFSMP
jgi:signal transduction histidine kinase